MRLLLDTHVLLWLLSADDRLSAEGISAIESADEVLVSAASVWEIEIKRAKGLLESPDDLVDLIEAAGVQLLSMTAAHATLAGRLPRLHNDPFDRMLIAQAKTEGAVLVTADHAPVHYGVAVQKPG